MAAGENLPVHLTTASSWSDWLEENHRSSPGVWLRISKKGSTSKSPTYAEALEAALCYGWIDAQKRANDDGSWLQRFVPRSSRSLWSRINRDKAEALIRAGRMKAAGREAVEQAKKNGRWDSAYDSPARATVPNELQAALDANPEAKAFFETLDSTNRYAVLFRIQTVKRPETRARKIAHFIHMLARKEKIHP